MDSSFYQKYKEIKKLKDHQLRGQLFEKLLLTVLEHEGILIENSYREKETGQQIDGAIEINGKIILLEIKWEKSKTLAASKLFSFLGKINSKLGGTIGLFISYNSLNDNILKSFRSGQQQTCILIQGEENILPLIKGKVNIPNYIWYLVRRASTHGMLMTTVEEFIAIPSQFTSISKTSDKTNSDDWGDLYNSMISNDDKRDFSKHLESKFDKITGITKKVIGILPNIEKPFHVRVKLEILLNKCIEEDQEETISVCYKKLTGQFWKKYADEYIDEVLISKILFSKSKSKLIGEKMLKHLSENLGNFDEENFASIILRNIHKKFDKELKNQTIRMYSKIFCDKYRKMKFAQKQFAEDLYQNLNMDEVYKLIKPDLVKEFKEEKDSERIFSKDKKEIKRRIIASVYMKYERILDRATFNLDDELDNTFENA